MDFDLQYPALPGTNIFTKTWLRLFELNGETLLMNGKCALLMKSTDGASIFDSLVKSPMNFLILSWNWTTTSGLMLNRTAPKTFTYDKKKAVDSINLINWPNSRINPYAISFFPQPGGPAMQMDRTFGTLMSPNPNVHCRKRYFTSPKECDGIL